MIKVGRYQMILLGLLFAGIAVLGPDFVSLWMGEEYRISGYCTILLIAPTLLLYPQQIANTLLSVRNKVKYQALIALFIGCINIIVSFLLTPMLGVVGSSISIMIANFISFILLNVVYWKQLNLKLGKFYCKIYLRYLPLIALCIIISLVICYLIGVPGWFGFAIKVLICIAVYGLIIGLIGVSSQERKEIIQYVKRRFKNER